MSETTIGPTWTRPAVALFAGASLLLGSAAAAAPPLPKSIAILVLSTESTGVPMSEIYGAARAVVEHNTVLEVASLEVFSAAVRAEAIRECAGDGRCFAMKLRRTGAMVDLLLTISADLLGDSLLLGLRLVDSRLTAPGERPDIAAVGQELAADGSFLDELERSIPRVFPRSIWGQVATIAVSADVDNAEALIGERTCIVPCEINRLRPGSYDVLVRKSGAGDWRTSVELRQGDTARVEAILQTPPSIAESPVFWGVLGAGVLAVAAGTVTFFLLRSDDPPGEICIAATEAQCR